MDGNQACCGRWMFFIERRGKGMDVGGSHFCTYQKHASSLTGRRVRSCMSCVEDGISYAID